jgi:DNA-binding NarL/FixJ family response regulator
MWVDQNPDFIAAGLVGVLFAMLNLESAYVRFDDPTGGFAFERWRPDGPRAPIELEPVLSAAPTREGGTTIVSVPSPSGDGTFRVTSMFPAFPGENGLVLVGSRRSDFPTDLELHHLRVAVGQATISIHTARRLAVERAARLAAETALRRRNEFLGSLAHDLVSPLAALAEHAARARALASEPEYSSPLRSVKTVPIVKTTDVPRSQAGAPLLALPARLTRREAEVLGLLAQGLSNKEIAGVLWLSDRTVERHITGLYRKIGVERRSEATAFAFHHGLVDADAHEA